MKIAQVCPYDFSRPGGVKNHIESLTKYLILAGHEVKIITPPPAIGQPNVYHFGRNQSLNFGGTKIDINIVPGRELKNLKRFLNEEKFDVIHYHTIWNPLLPAQVRLNANAKHVATFHDTPKSQLIGKTIMPAVASLVFPFLDQVISVSETQRKFISRFSKKQIHVIPNGIDLQEIHENYRPIQKYQAGKFNLLFLGRLEPRKGLIYALQAYKKLKASNSEIRLIIAGDGDERSLAEDFVFQNQLQDVDLLGFVDEETKKRLLKTADLYLAPAVYGESFGIVLLEAMAVGTPIAGFSNAGYQNVITEEMKPYFPTPQDTPELVSAIEKLMSDKEKRMEMAAHGLGEVKKYDWKILVKKVESLYL